MYEQILPWVGLGALLILCLPVPVIQRALLEVATWVLRLALIALLAGGAYLWFRPEQMPSELSAVLGDFFPRLLALLPAQGTPAFGLSAACLVAAPLVPVLAAFDVARRWACRAVAVTPVAATRPVVAPAPVPPPAVAAEPEQVGVPIMRPIERRTAAAAIASAARPTPRPAH